MAKYYVSGSVTISIYTEVEADSPEKAKEIAEGRAIEESRWGDKQQPKSVWIADEYDGEPQDIHIEAAE